MEQQPYLEKIFIGKVKTIGNANATTTMEKVWKSGMFKEPVRDSTWLGKVNLDGDEQADLKHHGGPEKAVMAYAQKHYIDWGRELNNSQIQAGAMGENFSVINMDEETVCIGDIYEIGEAVIQVSQPRQPCWKPARRFKTIDFALRIQKSGRTGWYFRVLKEGFVKEQTAIKLIDRPYPEWTIAKCNEVMHEHKTDLDRSAQLAACRYLAINWRETLTKRVQGQEAPSIAERVYGPNVEK
ncbi:MOSC domain-containing protein YiiM [Cytobacillus eiseniae]|uniref:MOSC domain-containing protein YiiM n=1 Tax=Cytobacillus eiseniae TaxID=762947 RepID=A0ABS4R9L7_9BACI|nr:MOSC domain-containing protein [Cytobacillus eiseniae]MBP2239590.1 MOSC domain-containing protein YiiM [Cytobacillus eiseniae]